MKQFLIAAGAVTFSLLVVEKAIPRAGFLIAIAIMFYWLANSGAFTWATKALNDATKGTVIGRV